MRRWRGCAGSRRSAGRNCAAPPLVKSRVHPRQVPHDLGDLAEPADSLTHDGQHQLIKVERRGDFFQILDGHGRFAAPSIARLRHLEAMIVPVTTDAEAVAVTLTTAVHAKTFSAAERLRGTAADRRGSHADRRSVSAATIRRWYHEDTETEPAGEQPASHAQKKVPRPCRTGERRKPTTVGVRRLTGLAEQRRPPAAVWTAGPGRSGLTR